MKPRNFLSVFLAVVMIVGMFPGAMLTAFASEQPETVLTLTTKNGTAEADTFTYGDVITIEATAVSGNTFAYNQAIGVYKDDSLLSGGVHITSVAENGMYIIIIDTKSKCLNVGEESLTVKFEGDDTMPAAQEDVTLTLNLATPYITASQSTVSLAYPFDENILQNSITYTFTDVNGSNSTIFPDSYEYRISGSTEDFTDGLPVRLITMLATI